MNRGTTNRERNEALLCFFQEFVGHAAKFAFKAIGRDRNDALNVDKRRFAQEWQPAEISLAATGAVMWMYSEKQNTRTLPCGCRGEKSVGAQAASFCASLRCLRQRAKAAPPASKAAAAHVPGSGTAAGAEALR
jgi:hypothetical protein